SYRSSFFLRSQACAALSPYTSLFRSEGPGAAVPGRLAVPVARQPEGARLRAVLRHRDGPGRRQPVPAHPAGGDRPVPPRRRPAGRDPRPDALPRHRRAALFPHARPLPVLLVPPQPRRGPPPADTADPAAEHRRPRRRLPGPHTARARPDRRPAASPVVS